MLNSFKVIKYTASCVAQSVRHPTGVVTCVFPNPGIVTTSALPWAIAAGVFALGFIGLFLGEYLKLPQCTQVSSHVVTGSFTYLLGRGQAMMEKRREDDGEHAGV